MASQHLAQGGHALRAVGRARRQHPVNDVQEVLAAVGHGQRGQGRNVVVHRAGGGRRRRTAQQQKVQRGAQRVDVGPGALLHRAGFGVLFDGRIGRFEDGGQRLALVAEHAAGRAEVEQHGAAIGLDLDVVGRDVAVVDAFGMQLLNGPQQRVQHAAQPGFIGRLGHGQPNFLDGAAAQHRHGHIGRAIAFPEAVHLQQRRVVEAGQQPGFVDEGLQAQREGFSVGLRAYRDEHRLGAPGQRSRHVFLHRHFAFQGVVEGQVDNAEAAHAQQAAQFELTQTRARRQRTGVGLVEAGSFFGHV